MTKSELVAAISERSGVSRNDVDETIKGMFDVVSDVVAKGEEPVSIPGWIKFEQSHRKARTARNPQTGAIIQVPATKSCKVSAGSKLKAAAKSLS